LDSELQQVREESEKRAATILSLEQEVKELKAEVKDLTGELEESRKGAVLQTEQQRKQMSREHSEAVSDLDNKMRQVEREAAIREDALRKEVDELRKRWQDAVRRADALSMDVQSSTAPLLRQLESANKQSRARSAAWAEMETQLRSELEETVISNEKLSKERSEWKTKYTRLERSSKEQESDLKQLKRSVEEKNARVKQLEEQVERMEKEGAKMKEEWAEVERLANEGVSRVRSEMTKTVVESEERYRTQLDSLESELRVEREKRSQLEEQVQTLLEKVVQTAESVPDIAVIEREAPPKKLRKSEGQIEILTGALNGLDNENDDEDDDDENDLPQEALQRSSSNFAALEELTSRLKAAKVELNTLRTRLEESESTRESLLADLAECRSAKEKLPLFEERVGELSAENQELSQEVQGLREDIVEVRELYRDQLNALLEEKTNAAAVNGSSTETASPEADTVRPTIDKGTAEDPSQAIAQESVQ
jgi:chromosome segregation ATPase